MYDLLKERISGRLSVEDKTNRTREYLQILALKILYEKEYFNSIAFVGGTALRVLFGLRRFSEDLDFSLINGKGYSFPALVKGLSSEFERYGLQVEASPREVTVVHSSMIKFPGLLQKLDISPHKGQKLSIKLEIDTNPPAGWETAVTPVTSSFIFAVKHFDLPSLFATKIHACFFRKYTKGRDFYDLLWYLGKNLSPNYTLLNNAVRQTEGDDPRITPDSVREFMKGRLSRIDFTAARKDIERFVEDKNELKMLNNELMIQLIENAQGLKP